jgi:hypothetical protein
MTIMANLSQVIRAVKPRRRQETERCRAVEQKLAENYDLQGARIEREGLGISSEKQV